MEMVTYHLWKWYVTTYGNGRGLFKQPLMEMEGDYLSNRLWKWKECLGKQLSNRLRKWKGTVWATVYGNGRELFGQPLMEMEGNCLGNRLWKWKGTV